MAKWANTSVLDALLDKVATSTQLIVTSTQPANRAAAISAALASTSTTGADFAKSADGTGRKVTVAQKASISISATGDATHVCLVDGSDLLYVTTVTTQTLASGNTVTIPAWTISVSAPS